MSMANRERAELPEQIGSVTEPELLVKMQELTASYSEIVEAIKTLRGHQIAADTKMHQLLQEFGTLKGEATKATSEAKAAVTKIEPALLALTKEMNAIKQRTDSFLDNQSGQLQKAARDVESLERKMMSGFGDAVSRVKMTFKERLYLVAVVAASSLTFSLLFTLLLHLLVFKKAS